jgi:hypothetical protein
MDRMLVGHENLSGQQREVKILVLPDIYHGDKCLRSKLYSSVCEVQNLFTNSQVQSNSYLSASRKLTNIQKLDLIFTLAYNYFKIMLI